MASAVLAVASEQMFVELVFDHHTGQGFRVCDICHSGNARNRGTVRLEWVTDSRETAAQHRRETQWQTGHGA